MTGHKQRTAPVFKVAARCESVGLGQNGSPILTDVHGLQEDDAAANKQHHPTETGKWTRANMLTETTLLPVRAESPLTGRGRLPLTTRLRSHFECVSYSDVILMSDM